MPTGPMQYGGNNDAGNIQTILRTQGIPEATLWLRNQAFAGVQGRGLAVEGGDTGVRADASQAGGFGVQAEGFIGVDGIGHGSGSGVQGRSQATGSGVLGRSQGTGSGVLGRSEGTGGTGNGVEGRSPMRNGVEGHSSSVAASGVYGENLSGGGFGIAGKGSGSPTTTAGGAAVLGHNIAGGWAGFFQGPVYVGEKLTKPGGGFRIDNPADPANSYLDHAWVESNDMMNVYNGNITTDDDGNATVELPGYFEALNRDFRYQLTVVGQFASAIVAEEVRDNRFRIKTDKPNVMVSWQVTGIRQDAWANANPVEVEVQKTEDEQGKYLHPEEHGQPATAGIIQIELPVSEETAPDSGQLQGE